MNMPIAVLQTVSLPTEIGAVLVLVLIGCVLTYLASRASLSREMKLLRAQLEDRLEVRNTAAPAKDATLVERPKAMAAAAGASAASTGLQRTPAAEEFSKVQPAAAAPSEEISEEVLVMIAAAVCAFLGKRARVRHTRLVHPEGASPWAQQGRVFVQASHNLGVSHHA
jgi:methylmalonyl-CoA carboxyltransferase large subunit